MTFSSILCDIETPNIVIDLPCCTSKAVVAKWSTREKLYTGNRHFPQYERPLKNEIIEQIRSTFKNLKFGSLLEVTMSIDICKHNCNTMDSGCGTVGRVLLHHITQV